MDSLLWLQRRAYVHRIRVMAAAPRWFLWISCSGYSAVLVSMDSLLWLQLRAYVHGIRVMVAAQC